MTFYVIIRGPLGCGKSTIAENISKTLNAKYFAILRAEYGRSGAFSCVRPAGE